LKIAISFLSIIIVISHMQDHVHNSRIFILRISSLNLYNFTLNSLYNPCSFEFLLKGLNLLSFPLEYSTWSHAFYVVQKYWTYEYFLDTDTEIYLYHNCFFLHIFLAFFYCIQYSINLPWQFLFVRYQYSGNIACFPM
jgi:hypothetical protein